MFKKVLYLIPLALLATACSDDDEPNVPDGPGYELRTLTFEDADAHFAPYNFENRTDVTISTWSDLIDNVEYGGKLLYNDFAWTGYAWHDTGNTELAGGLLDGGPYWNGGAAVSSYYTATLVGLDYTRQLGVNTGSEGAAGHNGSRNFCVHNGYVDGESYKDHLPALTFADGVERTIDHMYVTNTAYTYSTLLNGNAYCAAAGADTWFKIIAIGYDKTGAETGTCEFLLCDGKDKIVNTWTKWDLSSLGDVAKIEFNMDGSADLRGEYGLNEPAYFAFDDVAVRFAK